MERYLIEKSISGDKNAFANLISIYRRQLFSYILRRCGNRELAEDIFQDVLIKVWKSISKYKEREKFSSWLFSIAHNVTIDMYRKRGLKYEEHPNNIEIASNENIQMKIENDERKELLENALHSLTEQQKEVLLLRQHGELKFKEIAEITKQPLNTVLSHMNYAVKKLKKILREENAA